MTPADLDLAAALRQLLRHPLVRDELRAIFSEAAGAARAEDEGFIGVPEAARRAGVKPRAVRAWIASGLLHAAKLPGAKGWQIRPADLAQVGAGEAVQADHAPVLDLQAHAAKQRQARADALAAAARKERDP